MHLTEILIIGTNALVVLSSLVLAMVTLKDVVKDDNKTLLAALREVVTVNNRKARKGVPEQEELALVPVDAEGKAA